MAFSTKDGKKKFGSAYAAKRYDSAHDEPANEKDAKKKFGKVLSDKEGDLKHEMDESPETQHEEGEDEMHPVVAEHGAAHHVSIHHDHNNGKHTVVSHHEDGHVNTSEHQDAKTAHEEGGKLANISLKKSGEQEDQQLAASEGGNSSTPDGFEMPSLV